MELGLRSSVRRLGLLRVGALKIYCCWRAFVCKGEYAPLISVALYSPQTLPSASQQPPPPIKTLRTDERPRGSPFGTIVELAMENPTTCFLGEPVPSSSQGISAQLCCYSAALLPRRRRLPSPHAGGAGVTRPSSKGKWAAKAAVIINPHRFPFDVGRRVAVANPRREANGQPGKWKML